MEASGSTEVVNSPPPTTFGVDDRKTYVIERIRALDEEEKKIKSAAVRRAKLEALMNDYQPKIDVAKKLAVEQEKMLSCHVESCVVRKQILLRPCNHVVCRGHLPKNKKCPICGEHVSSHIELIHSKDAFA